MPRARSRAVCQSGLARRCRGKTVSSLSDSWQLTCTSWVAWELCSESASSRLHGTDHGPHPIAAGPRGKGTTWPAVCQHFVPPPANVRRHPYSHSTGHGHLTVVGKGPSYQVLERARTPHLRAGVSDPETGPVLTGSHGRRPSHYTMQSQQPHCCFQLESSNMTPFSPSF